MLNSTVSPRAPATSDRESTGSAVSPFDLSSAFETQARLWNHMLDANRSFWAVYAPWLPPAAWNWGNAVEPARAIQESVEAAQTADGVPDALESQARLWNHLLDANRNFWSAFTWAVPGAPWLPSADDQATAANDAQASPTPRPAAQRHKASASPRRKTASRSR
jgi:hypothetical protein